MNTSTALGNCIRKSSAVITLLTVFLGATVLLTTNLQAQNASKPNTLTEKEKNQGWKLLFDGKTLDGWKSWKTKEPLQPGKWQVKNGALTLTGKGGGDIYTADAFENFLFTIEFRTTGNSGIFFRVNPDYNGSIWKPAPEIQVLKDNPTDTSSHSAGALYDLYSFPTDKKKMHPNGWNQVAIKLVGNHYQQWFNGQKVVDVEIGSKEWNKRIKKSKFNVDIFGKTRNGHFGLQDHGYKVQFRNIKVKPLTSQSK